MDAGNRANDSRNFAIFRIFLLTIVALQPSKIIMTSHSKLPDGIKMVALEGPRNSP